MNNGERYICAIDPTPGATRAVMHKDGEILGRFLTHARGRAMIEEFSDFLHESLQNASQHSLVIFTGSGHGRRWTLFKDFMRDRHGHPSLFLLDLLPKADSEHTPTEEDELDNDERLHRLELLAYLRAHHYGKPGEPPNSAALIEDS